MMVERGWLQATGKIGSDRARLGEARRDRVRGERPRVEIAGTELAVAA